MKVQKKIGVTYTKGNIQMHMNLNIPDQGTPGGEDISTFCKASVKLLYLNLTQLLNIGPCKLLKTCN